MSLLNFEPNSVWIGDNLPILRGMNSKCVDLIYLDPPFNSNTNYIARSGSKAMGAEFKDKWDISDISNAWVEELKRENQALHDYIGAVKKIKGDAMEAYLIYMAIRLIEMKRILKDTGSIYLHCDDAAGHFLKLLMDSIFGERNFINEIVWKRVAATVKGNQFKSRSLVRDVDYILHYSVTKDYFNNNITLPVSDSELLRKFPKIDENGHRYNTDTPLFSVPAMPPRPNLCYTYNGVTNPYPSGWRVSKEKLKKLDEQGAVIWRKGKRPLRKKFANDYDGKPIGCIWSDINNVTSGKEFSGYPTQKPLKLLTRIIEISSKPDDIVFDPFCGSGTTLMAASKLGRQWVGIDISEKALELLKVRMESENPDVSTVEVVRREIPERSNI